MNYINELYHWIISLNYITELYHWIISLNYITNYITELYHWIISLNYISELYHWIISLNYITELFHWIISLNYITELYHELFHWFMSLNYITSHMNVRKVFFYFEHRLQCFKKLINVFFRKKIIFIVKLYNFTQLQQWMNCSNCSLGNHHIIMENRNQIYIYYTSDIHCICYRLWKFIKWLRILLYVLIFRT